MSRKTTNSYPPIILHECYECPKLIIGYPDIFGNYYCERHK